MKEEEVRNTFYCRTEYAAFKEAYRTHRDTSTGWCRGNDVLPCSCDSCQDDLVKGDQPEDDHSDDSPGGTMPPPPRNPYEHDDNTDGEEEEEQEGQHNEPPSPVGAVFQEDSDSSGSDEASDEPRAVGPFRALPRRPVSAHGGSRPWGVGSVPIAAPPASITHKRGGSLDDWGAASRIREAVKCHGEGYAYNTLRHQGFSDLYIKTHFLPDS